jgi:hypothetical protein
MIVTPEWGYRSHLMRIRTIGLDPKRHKDSTYSPK